MNKQAIPLHQPVSIRVQPDVLLALETKLTEIAKTMRENKTILAYEMIRTLQEFIAYERAKHSAQ
jgi:hypothetical protein